MDNFVKGHNTRYRSNKLNSHGVRCETRHLIPILITVSRPGLVELVFGHLGQL
jgi:hypothetical protein